MRQRARIVLLAADGAATREISWQVGCTIGTASKWRVRRARDRLTELSEVGERGAKPKYGEAHQSRILALLDQPRPAGYAKLPRELVDIYAQYLWRLLRAQKIDLLVRERRPGIRHQGRRHCRPRHEAAGQRGGAVDGREAVDSGH
jgi:transposase